VNLIQTEKIQEFPEALTPLIDIPIDWVADSNDSIALGPQTKNLLEENVSCSTDRR